MRVYTLEYTRVSVRSRRPDRGGRLAHDELDGDLLHGGHLVPFEHAEERGGRGTSQVVVREPHRRERRLEVLGELHVVEADHREVIGDAQAVGRRHLVDIERQEVRVADDGGGPLVQLQQPLRSDLAVFVEDARHGRHQLAPDADAMAVEGLDEAGLVIAVRVSRRRRREQPDAAMAEGDEVLDGHGAGRARVGEHGG